MKLKYPEGLLNKLRKTAALIAERNRNADPTGAGEGNETPGTGSGEVRYLAAPHSLASVGLDRSLQKVGVIIANTAGTKIGEIVKRRNLTEKNDKGIIYQIPCGGCDRSYYGESGRDIATRTSEHKRDIRAHRTSNSLVVHVDE